MKSTSRYLILSTLSLSLLAGCNDSSKNDSPPQQPEPETETTVFYGPESTGLFMPKVLDSNGLPADINSDGVVNHGNISTTPIDDNDQGVLRINIKAGKPATFMTSSASGQAINIAGSAAKDGIYQFDLRVHDKPYENRQVLMQASSGNALDGAPAVDLTSTMNALAGRDFHTIKVPASCFEEQGMDFSQTITGFALTSESNLSFDIGNIQMIPDSADASSVLHCQTNSETLTGLASDIYRRWQGDGGGYVRTGWGNNPSFHYPAEAHYPEEGGIGAKYPNADFGDNGGLTLNIKSDDSIKDISRFVETGVLSFDLTLVNTGSHSGNIEIRMGSEGDSDNQAVLLTNLKQGVTNHLSIPLNQFFTRQDGKLDVASLQRIDRPLVIQPETINESETLRGFEFVINNVSLEMIPASGKCIPE